MDTEPEEEAQGLAEDVYGSGPINPFDNLGRDLASQPSVVVLPDGSEAKISAEALAKLPPASAARVASGKASGKGFGTINSPSGVMQPSK